MTELEGNRSKGESAAGREQDDDLESFAARSRRELHQRDLERINQHAERLNREMAEVLVYQAPL